MNQKFLTALLIIAGVILLLEGGTYIYMQNKRTGQPAAIDRTTYRNEKYGFEFEYPNGMNIVTLKVDGPRVSEDQFYVKELDNARLVGVSVSSLKNNRELLAYLNNLQGSGFTNVEKDFFNLGKAVFHTDNSQQGPCASGAYEVIIRNGYQFTFMDYAGCSNGKRMAEIMETFRFTE